MTGSTLQIPALPAGLHFNFHTPQGLRLSCLDSLPLPGTYSCAPGNHSASRPPPLEALLSSSSHTWAHGLVSFSESHQSHMAEAPQALCVAVNLPHWKEALLRAGTAVPSSLQYCQNLSMHLPQHQVDDVEGGVKGTVEQGSDAGKGNRDPSVFLETQVGVGDGVGRSWRKKMKRINAHLCAWGEGVC